jgi:hypothetical protein
MVDNFKLIRDYIEKKIIGSGTWKEGDCFYVQLLRRQADDPLIDGKKDKKYHGNMHSRSIKDYLIKSLQHLDDVEEDIKLLCKEFNVRAYIRLNKRNYKNINLEMMKHIAEQCASGETYSSPYHLVSSACGQTCQAGKNKTWIVDLDKEYLPYEKDIIDMICQCMPISKEIQEIYDKTNEEIHNSGNPCGVSMEEIKNKYIQDNFFIVPTKNGKHIVCKPFNKMTFQQLWDKSEKLKNIKMLDVHKDNPTILFVPDMK